jgi:hypothetical protein
MKKATPENGKLRKTNIIKAMYDAALKTVGA